MNEFKYPRDFKGVWIPAEIYLNEGLTPGEKVLFTEIDSLDRGEGCRASQRYLAGFCKMSLATLERGIRKLADLELIYAAGYKNRCRIWRSSLKMREVPPSERGNYNPQNEGQSNIGSNTVSTLPAKAGKGKQKDYHEQLFEKLLKAKEEGNLEGILVYGMEDINGAPFSNYAKEWKSAKAIVKKIHTVCNGTDPREFLHYIVAAFLQKKKSSKQEFWKEAPLTPSSLSTRFDQAYEFMRKKVKDHQEGEELREILGRHKL